MKNKNSELIENFGEYLKIVMFQKNTVDTYRSKVVSYLAFCYKENISFLKSCEINRFLLRLQDKKKLSASTLNIYAVALKHFYRFLRYKSITNIDINSIQVLTFKHQRRSLYVPTDYINITMRYATYLIDSDPRKIYINMLYGTGMRPSEAISVRKNDFRIENDRLLVRFFERKKQKFREVPFMDIESAKAVLRCLDHYQDYYSIFPGIRMLQYYLEELKSYFGINITARSFRHDFAYRMLNINRLTISQLQSLLGHTNPAMSMWYALTDSSNLIDIAPKISH